VVFAIGGLEEEKAHIERLVRAALLSDGCIF
jgi:hypothetical protein